MFSCFCIGVALNHSSFLFFSFFIFFIYFFYYYFFFYYIIFNDGCRIYLINCKEELMMLYM